MTMTLLQTVGLVGIVKMKWPAYIEPLMSFASIFMLDLSSLNFTCWGFMPFMSYIFSVLLWPGLRSLKRAISFSQSARSLAVAGDLRALLQVLQASLSLRELQDEEHCWPDLPDWIYCDVQDSCSLRLRRCCC